MLSMIGWSTCPAVEQDPGQWRLDFRGTRVSAAALFENLEDDAAVHQFVDWFPGIMLAQARPESLESLAPSCRVRTWQQSCPQTR